MNNKHPQASTSGVSGVLATLLIWALGVWTGVHLTAEDGSLITVATISVVLLIGRHGIKGLVNMLWWGEGEWK